MNVKRGVPECYCGIGLMVAKCAGPDAQHEGHWYYKYPKGKSHWKSFFWCDEYHQKQSPDLIPDFLASQKWGKGGPSSCDDSTFSSVGKTKIPQRHTNDCSTETPALGPKISVLMPICVWVFMFVTVVLLCFIILILGVILGKLM